MSDLGILAALLGMSSMTVGTEPRRRSFGLPAKTPNQRREQEKRNRRKEIAKASKKRNRGS